ncbi:protein-disulfide reductase DsbD domain-containing protein [Paracoccus aminophilus]|uniref:Thiol:disulfide interchange protein DsbD N-terminal domain-containing protein n=1 Tax=Paracoccus aminophilus JCM 7686 TaxID=1367847 RepID=S5XJL1_PARAH|nr:protein-disulfide reductase DsbD domain-containing protein [Paracoccus aminophilus]AGT07374.1 hypothetical protein JCM7686_0263 [Paracoccus aminophilus JCM 7686]
MKRFILALAAALISGSAQAQEAASAAPKLPPGLESAQLRPGWITPEGHRIVALDLRLLPGWKTYWRNPGDGGVPPVFDWQGSDNLGKVTLHWPRPEVIDSGGLRTLGFHDQLVLPIEIAPADPTKPIRVEAQVDLGICETICVPAHVDLTAAAPGDKDPIIQAALASVPDAAKEPAICKVTETKDGMRVAATVPLDARDDMAAAAMELADTPVWVSEPEVEVQDGKLTATADFIDDSGKPFALDPAQLRLTLISGEAAVEFSGCQTAG